MAELVFAMVFDTHMCRKKLTERRCRHFRKQTILRRSDKIIGLIVFARRRAT